MEIKKKIEQKVVLEFTYDPRNSDAIKTALEWLDVYEREHLDHEIIFSGSAEEVIVRIMYPKFVTRPDYPKAFAES